MLRKQAGSNEAGMREKKCWKVGEFGLTQGEWRDM